jgi:hypothetical protein
VQADADSGGGAEAGVKGGQWRRRTQAAAAFKHLGTIQSVGVTGAQEEN